MTLCWAGTLQMWSVCTKISLISTKINVQSETSSSDVTVSDSSVKTKGKSHVYIKEKLNGCRKMRSRRGGLKLRADAAALQTKFMEEEQRTLLPCLLISFILLPEGYLFCHGQNYSRMFLKLVSGSSLIYRKNRKKGSPSSRMWKCLHTTY